MSCTALINRDGSFMGIRLSICMLGTCILECLILLFSRLTFLNIIGVSNSFELDVL